MKELVILNAANPQSEAGVEAALTLTANQATLLEKASSIGKVLLSLLSATKVGAPAYTVTGIEVSYDGTNFVLAQGSLTLDPCTNVGQFHAQITFPLLGVQKLRLVAGGTPPDGSNHVVLTAKLLMSYYP